MAILQVNVRPADFRRNGRSQGCEQSDGIDPQGADNLPISKQMAHRIDEYSPPKPNQQQYSSRSADTTHSVPVWQRIVWKLMPATTVGRALISATERLRDAQCRAANLDAQVILAHVLGVERSWLFAHYDYTLDDDEAERFTDAVARRTAGEPVAYLIGRREFYGLELTVDRRVLIPRPETELLVDAVLHHLTVREPQDVVRIADIGTGSGAIALAIAANAPHTELYAVDISRDALDVARVNAEKFELADRVTVLEGDLLATLPTKVDIVVANLPYINSRDYNELDVTVRDFEPKLALEAGPEGMDSIRRLLHQVPHVLGPNGLLILEIAHDQGALVLDAVNEILPQARQVDIQRDYADLDRVVIVVL